jgi:hypothetical protein
MVTHPYPNPPLEGEGIFSLLPLQGGDWEGDGVRKRNAMLKCDKVELSGNRTVSGIVVYQRLPPVSPESPPRRQRPPQVVYPGRRRDCPYGCGGHRSMLAVKGLFSVACPPSFYPFVAFCRWSVSDPFPYPSCPCLPLCTSSSRCPSGPRREGAAVS